MDVNYGNNNKHLFTIESDAYNQITAHLKGN